MLKQLDVNVDQDGLEILKEYVNQYAMIQKFLMLKEMLVIVNSDGQDLEELLHVNHFA
jgi:hypothetical protein